MWYRGAVGPWLNRPASPILSPFSAPLPAWQWQSLANPPPRERDLCWACRTQASGLVTGTVVLTDGRRILSAQHSPTQTCPAFALFNCSQYPLQDLSMQLLQRPPGLSEEPVECCHTLSWFSVRGAHLTASLEQHLVSIRQQASFSSVPSLVTHPLAGGRSSYWMWTLWASR